MFILRTKKNGYYSSHFLFFLFCFFIPPQLEAQLATPFLQGQLNRLIINNPVFNQGYTGFCLYDPELDEYLFDHRADQRFTPASNAKLLTFYLATQLLKEKVPALWYEDYGDYYEIWGSGYPWLDKLHRSSIDIVSQTTAIPPALNESEGGLSMPHQEIEQRRLNPLMNWLVTQDRPIVLHLGADQPTRYGPGWSYDDWNDGFVYERNTLTVYGNRLKISLNDFNQLEIDPVSLAEQVEFVDRPDGPRLLREEMTNVISLDTSRRFRKDYERSIALRMTPELTGQLLAEQLQQAVEIGDRPLPVTSPSLNRLNLPLPDTLYQVMLQQSDNFLAEQLILLTASSRYNRPDPDLILEYATDTLLADLTGPEIQWVDGSGLSRYNQISPRQMTAVLDRIQDEIGMSALLAQLPANGVSGTLEHRFENARPPYIWAKTGSLRNVIALSGVIRARSGRYLIFSFLHNHTQEGSSVYYREMEKVFELLYRDY